MSRVLRSLRSRRRACERHGPKPLSCRSHGKPLVEQDKIKSVCYITQDRPFVSKSLTHSGVHCEQNYIEKWSCNFDSFDIG